MAISGKETKKRPPEGDLQLGEERLQQMGVDQVGVVALLGQHIAQRLDEKGEDVRGHVPAAEKGDDEPDGGKGETPPEFDQMVDQRRARLFDIVDHGLPTRRRRAPDRRETGDEGRRSGLAAHSGIGTVRR